MDAQARAIADAALMNARRSDASAFPDSRPIISFVAANANMTQCNASGAIFAWQQVAVTATMRRCRKFGRFAPCVLTNENNGGVNEPARGDRQVLPRQARRHRLHRRGPARPLP